MLGKDQAGLILILLIVLLIFIIYIVILKVFLSNKKYSLQIIKLIKTSYVSGSVILVLNVLCRMHSIFLFYFLITALFAYILATIYTLVNFILNLNKIPGVFVPFFINILLFFLTLILPTEVVNLQTHVILNYNRTEFNYFISKIKANINASNYVVPQKYKKLLVSDSTDIFKSGKSYNIVFYVNHGYLHTYDAILFTSDGKILIPEKDVKKRELKPNWYRISGNYEFRY